MIKEIMLLIKEMITHIFIISIEISNGYLFIWRIIGMIIGIFLAFIYFYRYWLNKSDII